MAHSRGSSEFQAIDRAVGDPPRQLISQETALTSTTEPPHPSDRVSGDRVTVPLSDVPTHDVARSSAALVERLRWKVAGACAARSFRVRGDYGVVEGSPRDDAVLGTYARRKIWAPVKNGLVRDFFDAAGGGTYLDIGANIGLTTIPIAQNPRVRCFSFEPEPGNFGYLQGNIARNCPYSNVTLYDLALLDRRGTVAVELSATNSGDHHVEDNRSKRDETTGHHPSILVSAARLNDVIAPEELVPPVVVKLIAQGAEARIIAGGEATLRRAELMILLFYPYGLARMGSDASDLCRFIVSHFQSGAAWHGEAEHLAVWLPIGTIAEMAEALSEVASQSPTDYLFLALRRFPERPTI
jgi:FkbM family methyltransferase